MDVGRHPKIKLLTYSEIEDISGYIGNFHVKVRKKTKYVEEEDCNACGECEKVCPVSKVDEHQFGFAVRKAIYMPFAQAVPSSYLINMEDCLGNNPIACGKCLEVCDKKCIDYDMEDEIVEFDVGTVIVATGMDVFDPRGFDEYGYTKYQNVLTSMEFEILTGPGYVTQGHLLRPSDMKVPKSIGFIQCVGSRDLKRGKPYCSNICCMNTVKDTLFLREHYPDMEAKVFYMDMRTFGKGFEDLYRRSKEIGVQYIRGIPGEIREDPETKDLLLTVENTTTGKVEEHRVEAVVLSVGVTPRLDSDHMQKLLTLSKTSDGFYMEQHPKLKPIDAPTGGVFLAGCAEAPKDVKDSVTQASAAAARAETILSAGTIKIEAITCLVDEGVCSSCVICSRVCPYGAIGADTKAKTPAEVIEAACKGCGTCAAECPFDAIAMRHFSDEQIVAMIDAYLAENPMEKVIVFACNWCSYAGADLAGLSRLQYPSSGRIIRTMCSGRVTEEFILRAFRKGAPVVLVSGCHFADCHYIDANRWTQKRVEKLWDRLEKLGIRPERLQLEWISAAEAQKWARTMTDMEELRKTVTEKEVEQTIKVLAEEEEKKKKKKAKKGKKTAAAAR
ncbi:MAG: hydrogenase iron-sulfur subunit [bacterium]